MDWELVVVVTPCSRTSFDCICMRKSLQSVPQLLAIGAARGARGSHFERNRGLEGAGHPMVVYSKKEQEFASCAKGGEHCNGLCFFLLIRMKKYGLHDFYIFSQNHCLCIIF